MKTFDHPANQSIASLLTVRPGDSMLGDSSLYYKDFDKHFKDSLNDEIVINDDDSDEVRGLKQAVIETKKELKVRMDRGEDLAKVMRDAREQLRELGLYRDELTAQVKSIAGDLNAELTEKDMHDLVDAANKMLDERGSEPLLLTGPMLYQLREQKIENENTNTEINQ